MQTNSVSRGIWSRRLGATVMVLGVLLAARSRRSAADPPPPSPAGSTATRPALDPDFAAALDAGATSSDDPTSLIPFSGRFPLVPTGSVAGTATWVKVTLNTYGKKVDAIRFHTPADGSRQLIAMFLKPRHSFFEMELMAAGGDVNGFGRYNAYFGDAFAGMDEPPRSLFWGVSLPFNNLKPDADYLVWFRFERTDPVQLELAINLLKTPTALKDWEALGLELK